jgi:hypothetical protein
MSSNEFMRGFWFALYFAEFGVGRKLLCRVFGPYVFVEPSKDMCALFDAPYILPSLALVENLLCCVFGFVIFVGPSKVE